LGNPPNPVADMMTSIKFIRKIKKLNKHTEIIMYRYDPVPVGGEMYEQVVKLGFEFPTSLEEWCDSKWRNIQRRTTADVPWLNDAQQLYLSEFQIVLNAYYPSATSRKIKPGSWKYWLLKIASSLRFHTRIYKKPVELNWLQTKLSYQRPEISGF